MSEVIEIPVGVWEHCQRDAETIAFLHRENARLKAEVERLTKELSDEKSANANVENRQQDHLRGLSMENFNLKAEVERLRKAGDAMDTFLGPCHASRQWRAAKEGRTNE